MKKSPYSDKLDKEFLAWIRTLPSVLSGKSPCTAAHVLSVAHGAGKGIKPKLFAVPLTDGEHRLQHQQGYLPTLFYFKREEIINLPIDPKAGLNWFKAQAMEYRMEFLKLFHPELLEAA